MKLLCINHPFFYEMEKICRLFFPFARITESADGPTVHTERKEEVDCFLLTVCYDGVCKTATVSKSLADCDKECELTLARLLYGILCDKMGIHPRWGI